MKPNYFRIMPWNRTPFATSLEVSSLVEAGGSPATEERRLSFKIGYDGYAWHDVIMAESGEVLFSEMVRDAVESDGLVGAKFVEAPIIEVLSTPLKQKHRPEYFRILAEGLIQVDHEAPSSQQRLIPTHITGPENCHFFCVNHPKRPIGHFCTFPGLETFRRHRIENLYITPLDYLDHPSDSFVPPFRIKLTGRKWPTGAWYPEGFVPHPNNLTEDGSD